MAMTDDGIIREIKELRALSVGDLRARWLEVFGEETNCRNKDYLFKRLAYRIQERKYGGLTDDARARAEELAKDAPIRRRVPPPPPKPRDPRLPLVGTVLRRKHGGVEHEVIVLDDGFEYQGERFVSLSHVARRISGTRWNGYGFFGLLAKEQKEAAA